MSQEEQPTPIIPATFASSDAEKWRTYQLESQQKTPERLEDAAKFLAGMISISLTIFLKLNPEGFKGLEQHPLTITAAVLWLLSLLAAFLVLFPVPYRYASTSSEDIKRMHRKVVRYKYACLMISALLFLIALGMLTGLYVTNPLPER